MVKKKIIYITLIFLVLAFAFACQDEWEYPYPFIKSLSVEHKDNTNAKFTGEIVKLGTDKIQEYGYFLTYNYGYKYFSNENIKNEVGSYEMNISSVLRTGANLKLGAYVKVNDQIILGKQISYTCTENVKPEILSITPISGDVNTIRKIEVKNFCDIYGYYVYVDGKQYSSSELTIVEPNIVEINLSQKDIKPGSYKVSVYNYGLVEYSEEIIVTE